MSEQQESTEARSDQPINHEAQPNEQSATPVAPIEAGGSAPAKKKVEIQGLGAPGWMATIVLCLMVSVATSAMTLWVYDRKFATKIVSYDLKGYVEQQALDFAAGKITQEQSTQNIIKLGETMKNVPANIAVITSDVAVRNIEPLKP